VLHLVLRLFSGGVRLGEMLVCAAVNVMVFLQDGGDGGKC